MTSPRRWLALSLLLAIALPACGNNSDNNAADMQPAADMRADLGGDMAADMPGDMAPDMAPDMGADMSGPLPLPPEPWDITQRGPFNVGYHKDSVTFTDSTGEERTLRVAYWYPTRDRDGRLTRYANLFASQVALTGASVTDTPAKLPVLVYSHGSQGFAEQSYFFTEYFATHGFIVVAPDHTGNTFRAGADAATTIHALLRPQDIQATLAHLDALPDTHPLHGRLSDDWVMSGYSYGGYTALALGGATYALERYAMECADAPPDDARCAMMTDEQNRAVFTQGFLDTRFKAILAQAPGGSSYLDTIAPVTTPVFLLTGGEDRSLPNETVGDPYWAQLDGDQHLRLNVTAAGHNAFSDVCDYNGRVLLPTGACDDETVDFPTTHRLVNQYSMAFVRFHLWGDDAQAPLLNGDAPAGSTASRKGAQLARVPR